MPRASQETIDRIREGVDIADVIGEHLSLKKAGKNYSALCPFHQEKKPSFSVNPVKQVYFCYDCQKGGNVFSFLMQLEGITFPEALQRLARRAGIELKVGGDEDDARARERELLLRLNELAAEFYQDQLMGASGQAARAYLTKRGINSEIIKRFRLGLAPAKGNLLLARLKREGVAETAADKAGLILKSRQGSGYYDRFRNRLMMPISNHYGKVIAFGGRTLDDEVDPKYLNSPETPLYHKSRVLYGLDAAREGIRHRDRLVIVEGYFDLLMVAQAGVSNIAAVLGTAFTAEQAKLVHRYTRQVVFVFDTDRAGIEATMRAFEMAAESGLEAKVVSLPQGKDPDDYVREAGAESFQKLLATGQNLVDYYLSVKEIGKRPLSLDERLELARRLIPLVEKIPDPVSRDVHRNYLAEKAGVSESMLRAGVPGSKTPPRLARQPEKLANAQTMERRKLSRLDRARLELLAHMLIDPELRAQIAAGLEKYNVPEDVCGAQVAKVSKEDTGRAIAPAAVLDILTGEVERSYFLSYYMNAEARAEREDPVPVDDYLRVFRSEGLKEKTSVIRQQMNELQGQGVDGERRQVELAEEMRGLKQSMEKKPV